MKNKLDAGICSVVLIITLVIAKYGYDNGGTLRTSAQGLAIIGNAEGCRRNPYYCPAQVLTVGIGTTSSVEKIQPHKTYTDEEIAELFAKGVKNAEDCVNRYANGRNMPQGAFDALTSITFNVGCSKLKHSMLYQATVSGYHPSLCNQFTRWVYANGKKLPGLVTRREKEKALCLTS